METVLNIELAIVNILWGMPLIILFFGTAVYLTIRMGFLQITKVGAILRNTYFKKSSKEKRDGEITSFQAAMTTLSAMVGVGNLAGVAGAVALGGPGVLFWMLVAGFFAMALKFTEIVLSLRYRRVRRNGRIAGGPHFYMYDGLKKFHLSWLGYVYSFALLLFSMATVGACANAISNTLFSWNGVPVTVSGVAVTFLTGLVLLGGIKRIANVCEIMAPVMAVFYVISGLIIICLNYTQIPGAIGEIITGAFNPGAMAGGAVGSLLVTVRAGLSRGVLSNEAGIGSSTLIHSAAQVKHPVEQGLWGPMEVFVDTFIVNFLTGFIIVLSGLWKLGRYEGAVLTREAFASFLPAGVGAYVVLITVMLFCFSTTLGVYRYWQMGLVAMIKNENHWLVPTVYCGLIYIMAVTSFDVVWALMDIVAALMAIPNLITVLLLSNEVAQLKDEYFSE